VDEKELLTENLWDVEPEAPIYRIARVDFLVSDIQNSVLTLPRVIGWEDTHEAAFFTRRVPLSDAGNIGLSELAIDWFGQCWSTQPESDAMWRIYNQKYDSVRIE
jgi:hypothetical protein